ncbi:MAG: DUF1707 SHOCT-like domain-containing protein [Trebonia sp.]
MSPTSSQQWSRRIRYSDQHLRVSDAERGAVAEQLGTHYSDGRLDQAEFDERVGRAMAAKTRGDLDGLFDDLPDPEPAGASRNSRPGDPAIPHRRRRSGFGRMLLLVVLAVVALSIASHVLTAFAFAFPWFWIAALVAVVLLVNRSAHHRHDR